MGPVYACNGRIVGHEEYFSAVLRDPARNSVGDSFDKDLELALLCPDLLPHVIERLTPGAQVNIMEGPRTVAESEILSVRMEEWLPEPVFDPSLTRSTDGQ